MTVNQLHVVDYIVFAGMLCVSVAIGVYHAFTGGRQRSTDEYLMGGRQMRVLPVALSYTVSYISTILLLGFPSEIYAFGSEYVIGSVGSVFGIVGAIFIYVPVFYPLKCTSVNEYLELRFQNKIIRRVACIFCLMGMILYSSVVLFGPATAIEAVTGIPAWYTIIIGSAVTIIYTGIGGFKAVIWTDVFQVSIMVIGMISLIIVGVVTVGGFDRVMNINREWGRLHFFNWSFSPFIRVTTWGSVIARFLLFLKVAGSNQASFQRYCSMPTIRDAYMVVLLAVPGFIILPTLAFAIGWIAFAHYTIEGCDPLNGGLIDNPNQIVPSYVMEVFRLPGAPGLFLAACTAASISTISSALNASAAVMWEDLIKPCFPRATALQAANCTKFLVVAVGVLATCLGILMSKAGGTVSQMMMTFESATDGPLVALYLLALLVPWVNWKGLVAGMGIGFGLGFWMAYGSYSIEKQLEYLPSDTSNCTLLGNLTTFASENSYTSQYLTTPSITPEPVTSALPWWLENMYSLSMFWMFPLVIVVTTIVTIVVSLLTGGLADARDVPPELVHPCTRWMCCGKSRGKRSADEREASTTEMDTFLPTTND